TTTPLWPTTAVTETSSAASRRVKTPVPTSHHAELRRTMAWDAIRTGSEDFGWARCSGRLSPWLRFTCASLPTTRRPHSEENFREEGHPPRVRGDPGRVHVRQQLHHALDGHVRHHP